MGDRAADLSRQRTLRSPDGTLFCRHSVGTLLFRVSAVSFHSQHFPLTRFSAAVERTLKKRWVQALLFALVFLFAWLASPKLAHAEKVAFSGQLSAVSFGNEKKG